jgi:epoxyqueuosine reductase
MNLTQLIKEKAYDLGFDLIGIAPADRAPHAEAYRLWLQHNYHAEMHWLARDPQRREDPHQILPGVQSVVVVGLSYFVGDARSELWRDPARGRIARYAWGQDYHEAMLPRLRTLGDFINRETGQSRRQRAYVDTGPILERDFAAQAGLGFIGKNTLLIHPQMGSYLFLGEVLIDLELEYDEPAPDGGASCQVGSPGESKRIGTCGNCTRCLEICPTHAFPAPYILNSNLCISYLTIEHRGAIPVALRPLIGNWIFGCDECQEICPWVRRYTPRLSSQPAFLHFDPDRFAPRLADLMSLDESAFGARFRGTPITRAKRRGFLRNVAVALGNWGSPQALSALEPALADPEPLIREHAAWAIAQIKS